MEVEYTITEILIPEAKVCSQCHLEKPLTDFSKKKDSICGTQAYCKSCQAAYWFRWKDTKEVMDTSTEDALYIMSISKLPGILKVGRSKNPKERALQLAASQPFLVNVDRQYDKYGFLELTVHRKLLPCRVEDGTGREWFRANASIVDAIVKGAIAEYELSQHKDVQNADN